MCLLICISFIAGAARTVRAARQAGEYEVKAAFLLNFAKFVEWPGDAFADHSAPIVIGVVGDSPFGRSLDQTIHGKSVGGRGLAIRKFSQTDDPRGCHILFICSSEKKRLGQILGAVSQSSILTVSDMDGFASAGGIINFVMDNNRVRFLINTGAASRARLRISSRLLTLARDVVE